MNEDTLEGEDVIMIEVEGHQIEGMTKRGERLFRMKKTPR